jgi:predicted transcriptional regulator
MENESSSVLLLISDIVSSYVANNKVEIEQLPELIRSIDTTLKTLGQAGIAQATGIEMPTKAQIKKSIRPQGMISFIDGQSYKTLKRHLSGHGMTVADYKAKFGLPQDYPIVSADYSAKRSALARTAGLGNKRAEGSVLTKPARKPPAKKKA